MKKKILFIVCLLGLLFMSVLVGQGIEWNSKPFDKDITVLNLVNGLFICLVVVYTSFHMFISLSTDHEDGYNSGFEEGQKQALLGNQQYKLIEFKNGEREIHKTPSPNDFEGEFKEFKIIK